jgi:hypothetical protein
MEERLAELSEQELTQSLHISDAELINVSPSSSLCCLHTCGLLVCFVCVCVCVRACAHAHVCKRFVCVPLSQGLLPFIFIYNNLVDILY